MEKEKVKKIFHSLYDDVNGRSLSLKAREDSQFSSKSFVYGEVVPDSFYEIIQETNPQPGQTFIDFGSGTGKAVLLAYLLFPYAECIGIELLDTLYNASKEVEKKFQSEFLPKISKECAKKKMTLVHGNILEADISNADIIFMNSTCFQDDLMEALEVKLEELKPHAQVISLSKGFRTPAFYMYKQKMYEFSWGQATAFFHRRRLWKVYD